MSGAAGSTLYLDGAYKPRAKATLDVEDRGFLFGDGVYEVVRYYRGRPFAMAAHVERMRASLKAVRIAFDWSKHDLARISDELVQKNKLSDAQVYWQVTRGTAPRMHGFPPAGVAPTVLALCYPEPPLDIAARIRGMKAITRPDLRWGRCSIKSINLLPNLLDTQAALDAGADLAILVRGRIVTECPSRSLFVVERGTLLTHPLDGTILDSITRRVVIELAAAEHIAVREERFDRRKLVSAEEVIVCGTTTEIASVVEIDRRKVGDGDPGLVARKLQRGFVARVWRECGFTTAQQA